MKKLTLFLTILLMSGMFSKFAQAQDVKMADAMVNFFDYDKNTPQKSGYLGQIPKAMLVSGNLKLSFDGIIENSGSTAVTPSLKVTVYNETNPTIALYEKNIAGTTAVAPSNQATLSLIDANAFTLSPYLPVGNYVVVFEAVLDDDTDLTNNKKTYQFYITHNLYSRDLKTVNSSISPADHTGTATNGDGIAVYLDFYQSTNIEGIDFYIAPNTELGTTLTFTLQALADGEDPEDDNAAYDNLYSQIYDIDDEFMIDAWNFITFTNSINISFDPVTSNYKRVRVLALYTFNSKTLALGADSSCSTNGNGIKYYVNDAWENASAAANPSLRLRITENNQNFDPIIIEPNGNELLTNLDAEIYLDYGYDISLYGNAQFLSQISITPDPGNVSASIEGSKIKIAHNTFQERTTYTVNIPSGTMSKDPAERTWRFSSFGESVIIESDDATLANLTVSNGSLTPAFSTEVTTYTVNVANEITEITITATTNDINATIAGDTATHNLTVGENTFTITVTAEDGKTTKDYTVTVTRADKVGVEQLPVDNEQLTVYPNPTSGQLTIENGKLIINKVEIFDINGKKLQSLKVSESSRVLDISNFAKGVYVLLINDIQKVRIIKE